MKTFILKIAKVLVAGSLALMLGSAKCLAQGPGGKDFGFGLVLIDPLGATIKLWINPVNALIIDIGASDFGPTRLGADYLWHFEAFKSRIVKMYAGPGLALAFGNGNGPFGGRELDRGDNNAGVGVRVMFGVNVIPERTPLEMFFELGPLVGLSQSGAHLDVGLGIRFYP